MGAQTVIVIYGVKSLIPRRTIVFLEHETPPADPGFLCEPGEGFFVVPDPAQNYYQQLAKALGVEKLGDARCVALHPGGTVVHKLMADPYLDRHPIDALVIIQDPDADDDWELQADQTFKRPPVKKKRRVP